MLEVHTEDSCALYVNGTINDANVTAFARSFGAVSYVCEQDVQCSQGWTHYVDDGGEGRDSCLAMSLQFNVFSWSAAIALNPPGSHVITIRSPNISANSSLSITIGELNTLAAFTMSEDPAPGFGLCGFAQLPGYQGTGLGWYWIDGTPADNLKCGSTGCGVWSVGTSPVTM